MEDISTRDDASSSVATPVPDHAAGDATRPASAEPVGAAFGGSRARRRRPAPLTGTANVLADNSGRLGLLSYLIPDDLEVRPGDAVRIPFGNRYVHGMVVGPGDPAKATRAIDEVFGVRSDPSDVSLAASIVKFHFSTESAVLPRLAPKTGRGADPQTADPLVLHDSVTHAKTPPELAKARRAVLVRAPLVDPVDVAATQAAALIDGQRDGQVLILCPTAALVEQTMAKFTSGAARLDAEAPRGAWKGFVEGTVRVGVGTRSAAMYAAAHLAGIIVLEENHPGHLESTQPHTHARDIAIARSRALAVPLRLITAVPSPQALGCGATVLTVGSRADWPRMRIVDRGDVDPVTRMLPPAVQAALTAAGKAGHKPVVLAQRRAAVRKCVRCAAERPCAECTSSLCMHPALELCPRCGCADQPKMRGWDKERLQHLLGKRARVVNLKTLGTIRDAGLVVIFDLDALASAPELIPGTLTAGAVVTAAEAAGRGGLVMGVADETATGGHPVVDALFGPRDMLAVARSFYTAARRGQLPPFGRLVTIRVKRARRPSVDGWPGTIHGPRQVGDEWEILVRIASEHLLELEPIVAKLRRGGKARVTVA